MLPCLLLTAALLPGQAPPVAPAPAVEAPAPAPPPTPDRWPLMRSLQGTWPSWLLEGNRMQVYGWTQGSFTGSTDRVSNLPLGLNYLANEALLQQNWLRIERQVVTSGTSEPTFGFRNDWILPGTDYRFTVARGLFDGQLTANHGRPNRYGIDPMQFYAEAYFPTIGRGMDVKVGRFFSQYGVESTDAVSNQLLSHVYTYLYDPFTHTGLLTTTKLTDAISVQAGLVLGSDNFIDPTDNPTAIGSLKWAPPNGRNSVLFSFIVDKGRFDRVHNFHNPEVFDLIWAHKINPRLTYTHEMLYGFTTNVPDTGFANWFGSISYLTRDLTPRLSTTARMEFFDDFQGQRTGSKGLYTAITAGLNFRPRRWMMLRPELRYDHNGESRPFEGNHGLFTAATDLILRW
ncbi:MAG TPA: outer membrane beta-barrel protein [Gemmataceae bacterium]|nr:outer membrane beta-barrel protein [Gemmataceae bacterium]